MQLRNFVIAAAAIPLARAADSSVCAKSLNVSTQSDLDTISSCTAFNSSIYVHGNMSTLVLNGVQNISGSLTVEDCPDLVSLSAPDLESVSGTLDLEVLTVLSTLSMPNLADLGGIKLVTLPELDELQFNAGVQNCRNILISDTSLSSLDGLDLSSVDTFDVNNNKNINDITVEASEISDYLSVAYNAEKVNVSLPNLKWVANATFRYCSSVDMSSLEVVNNTLAFVNNTIYSLDFQNVTKVGSLEISSNSELRNVSFANLTEIDGGLVIANNTKLTKVYGFPNLERVHGAIEMEGNLTQASFPSLDEIDGGVYIDSDNVFNCTTFNEAHEKGDIYGDNYVCRGASTTISTTLSSATYTSTSSSGSATKSATSTSKSASATSTSSKSSSSSSSSRNNAMAVTGSSGLLGLVAAALLEII